MPTGLNTIYVPEPTTTNQVANKAYVDTQASGSAVSFLMRKEFQGELVSDEGALSAAGDLASLTASAGKDLYVARAQVIWSTETADLEEAISMQVVLKINDVIIETCMASISQTGAGGGSPNLVYEFKNMGFSVAATQIIKLEVINIAADIQIEGFLSGVEVDTGANPTS